MNPTQPLFPFDLGDKRRNDRANRIVAAALAHPGASIPDAAGSRAATYATYDFFDNPSIHPEDLDDAHARSTLDRFAERGPGVLLIAQDTTPLDFTSPARNPGLGQLAHAKHFGLLVHSGLAMTADGVPLGLLHQHVWMRPPDQRGKRAKRRYKETAEKESQRWLDTERACVARLRPDQPVVLLSDREADFYDYFALPRRPGQDVVVRAKGRRRVDGTTDLLGVAIGRAPVQGMRTIRVPRTDGTPGRSATLAIRFGTYALMPPSTHPRRAELSPLPVQVVYLEEVDPPAQTPPIRWLLLTTRPVATRAAADQVVDWYVLRWRIERYHYTLKSGCRIEDLQLETADRLRRALSVYAMVAARLLHLTYLARQDPDGSCEPSVGPDEWAVLWHRFGGGQPPPATPPSRHQVIHWIARLGGWLGRTGDGDPGVKVLWRGLRALHDLVAGFRLGAQAARSEQKSG